MNAPHCHVTKAETSREGDDFCVDIHLHAGVKFRFVFTSRQAADVAEKLLLLTKSKPTPR